MEELLFLAHRIPYPPNKGDKIRSFNLLKQLGRDYRVHLGAFVDDPADWRYQDELRPYCSELYLKAIDPRWRKVGSLVGLARGEALTLPYYRDAAMLDWVRGILQRPGLGKVLVFSAAMAQYVAAPDCRQLHRVIDFVDVDSDKWRQFAASKPWPLNWIYNRESRRLLEYERRMAAGFSASVFVSEEEAELFRRLAPEASDRVHAVHNGVDTDYFSPANPYANPYGEGEQVLAFTGAMDYWANVDAVTWFARQVFPHISQALPQARFYIVGARPTPAVRQLGRLPGVQVTGAVRDIRPYLAHARAAVAPLRIARGVQNKVLEALSMAKPVLATQAAMDGIHHAPDQARWVAEEPLALADLASRLLRDEIQPAMGEAGRAWVVRHYSWAENLERIVRLLETADTARPAPQSQCYGAVT